MRQKDAFVIITRKISSEAEAGTEAEYVNANDAIDDGFTNNIEFIFEGDKINNPSPLKNNITFDEYNNTIEFTFEGDKIKNPSSPPPKNKNGTCTTRITHSPSADIVAVDDAGRCSYKNPFGKSKKEIIDCFPQRSFCSV